MQAVRRKVAPATGLIAKEFEVPAKGADRYNFHKVVMRELNGQDRIEASIWADKNINPALEESIVGQMDTQQREALRLSIVAVDGKRVNTGGVPFMAMDEWNIRSMRFLEACFNDLNGVDLDEVKNSIASGKVVEIPGAEEMEEIEDDHDPHTDE